jgi:superfamily II DNA or RNA helicase
LPEKTLLEAREYQKRILELLREARASSAVTLVELDCGLGKRVLIYLLASQLMASERILVLLQSRSSLEETALYLKETWQLGGVGVLTEGNWRARLETLESCRVTLTLPQTLLNTLKRTHVPPDLACVVINEVDLVVRRTASRRLLVYPYPALFEILRGIWKIGLSATLRDSHVIVGEDPFSIVERSEISSLIEGFQEPERGHGKVRVIRMEELRGTDISRYLSKTVLEAYEVRDQSAADLLSQIDQRIGEVRRALLKSVELENPEIAKSSNGSALRRALMHVEDEKEDGRALQSLYMLRKFVTGMLPRNYAGHVWRARIAYGVPEKLPKRVTSCGKAEILPKLLSKTTPNLLLCSYVKTAEFLSQFLGEAGWNTFLVTGQTGGKGEEIDRFRKSKTPSVLIMTAVGERDIDLPEVDLTVVWDTINTVKTMYQKFKRSRGGKVICLYYGGTFEEAKVRRVIGSVQSRYSWSVSIQH